jgi:acetyl-CoA decarbonylase/synthase complex subunit beta
MVFTGGKWRAGWALVLGGDDQGPLLERLGERDFMIYTDRPGTAGAVYIGNRQTSPVYFLQLMVRYGLIWGRIPPGDDHELGHFLEADMPGFMIIAGDLDPLKTVVALGLMKLGCPAVVPSSFPFPYGRRAVADSVDDIIEEACRFPNLRQRFFEDEVISLPGACNPAYARETVEPVQRFGDTPDSFFCLREVDEVGDTLKVIGAPEKGMGIMVEVAHKDMSEDVALTMEDRALDAICFLPGVHAAQDDGIFRLELGANAELDEERIAAAIHGGIRVAFPRLKDISVQIIYDPHRLAETAREVGRYKAERREKVEAMTDANTDEFVACTECRPFSLGHTCLATPQRPAMCASRSYASIKAAALFGSSAIPYKRRAEERVPLRKVFRRGKVLDAERGEYEGCNAVLREVTGGDLDRVFLHSLRAFPHTSCGCFKLLAFWIEEVGGIGVMKRNAVAIAPDGSDWARLANRAGGKQSPGIAGLSVEYMRSPEFLRGDGGIANVVWVDTELYEQVSDLFPADQKVATERDVSSIEELKRFLGREPECPPGRAPPACGGRSG